MPSDLQYCLLGPVEVRRDGQPLRLGPPKARVLLGYLLLHAGEVVSTDRLTDALWGETPPASAGHALQVYVSGLRAVLEPDREPSTEARVLRTRRPGYRLAVDPDRVDAHRFEQLVEQGRREAAAGRADGAAERLSDALALWRGPALADLADEPFAAAEAGRLEELRVAATEDRVDAELALGRHADVVAGLSALIG
ncbi:MAG: AfsR/SARP family transcriptional regulator, partial [Pseudonocardia sp.]|nr:AfsR/SARP family transcriptional regulator [Pseudonocardia sp.]